MCVGEDIMGKVVFNIVETDYDVSKDEEKYQKFRKDYLENLSVGVCVSGVRIMLGVVVMVGLLF